MQNGKFTDSNNCNNCKNYVRRKSFILDTAFIVIRLFNIIIEVQYFSLFLKIFRKKKYII